VLDWPKSGRIELKAGPKVDRFFAESIDRPASGPHTFTAELINPWEMTTTPLSGTFTGRSRIKLAGRPYQALCFRRI
jgi:hypothetical protein